MNILKKQAQACFFYAMEMNNYRSESIYRYLAALNPEDRDLHEMNFYWI